MTASLRGASLGLATSILAMTGCGDELAGPASGPDDSASRILRIKQSGPGGSGHGKPEPPSVSGHLIAEIAPGWTVQQINQQWETTTVRELAGTSFALLYLPFPYDYDGVAAELLSTGACVSCGRDYFVQAPEAEQVSVPFYEGTLVVQDFVEQYALETINAPAAHAFAQGTGVTVAIIDTGVDFSHPDLAPFLSGNGWDFVGEDPVPQDEQDGIDQDGDGLVDEAAGHGTHVTGIVHAAAPGATLMPVRVLDSEGVGTVFDVARGIRHATMAGAAVVNLSLGFRGTSRVIERVIVDAHDAGVFFVASAGNAGKLTHDHFPAKLPEVVAVAATDAADLKASFSNFGLIVSVSAPGDAIVSTYLFQGYAAWSGTSMAAPFVAGAGALAIQAFGNIGAPALRQLIEARADDLDLTGQSYAGLMGEGRVDLLDLVGPQYPSDVVEAPE